MKDVMDEIALRQAWSQGFLERLHAFNKQENRIHEEMKQRCEEIRNARRLREGGESQDADDGGGDGESEEQDGDEKEEDDDEDDYDFCDVEEDADDSRKENSDDSDEDSDENDSYLGLALESSHALATTYMNRSTPPRPAVSAPPAHFDRQYPRPPATAFSIRPAPSWEFGPLKLSMPLWLNL